MRLLGVECVGGRLRVTMNELVWFSRGMGLLTLLSLGIELRRGKNHRTGV